MKSRTQRKQEWKSLVYETIIHMTGSKPQCPMCLKDVYLESATLYHQTLPEDGGENFIGSINVCIIHFSCYHRALTRLHAVEERPATQPSSSRKHVIMHESADAFAEWLNNQTDISEAEKNEARARLGIPLVPIPPTPIPSSDSPLPEGDKVT
jgi:hypothetical protein